MNESPQHASVTLAQPRQRPRRTPDVLVVFSSDDVAVRPLMCGARTSTDKSLSLDLLLRIAGDPMSGALTSMDRTLQLVRQARLSLEVHVYEGVKDPAGWIRGHEAPIVRILGSPRTLARVSSQSSEPAQVLSDVSITAVEAR